MAARPLLKVCKDTEEFGKKRTWLFPFQVIYEVTVVTGDVQNAGTDTLIYMSVFGANGSTEEMPLQKNEDR